MSEPRCPGCDHPRPLHTMAREYHNELLPILIELIDNLSAIHKPVTLANDITICKHSLDTYPCVGASAVQRAQERMDRAMSR